MDGQMIVDKAREYLGTPFQWGARVKGAGIDCSGLVVCVLKDLGVDVPDRIYRRTENVDALANFASFADEVGQYNVIEPGDIAVFETRGFIHLGIVTEAEDLTVIHANNSPGYSCVCEEPLNGELGQYNLTHVYRVRMAN
jgi:cell wall-associated NlpC family hydrolase